MRPTIGKPALRQRPLFSELPRRHHAEPAAGKAQHGARHDVRARPGVLALMLPTLDKVSVPVRRVVPEAGSRLTHHQGELGLGRAEAACPWTCGRARRRRAARRMRGHDAGAGTVLAAAPAVSTPEDVESSLGLGRAARRMVQAGLASLGYEPGPADGLFGLRTREAIRRYQGGEGVRSDGISESGGVGGAGGGRGGGGAGAGESGGRATGGAASGGRCGICGGEDAGDGGGARGVFGSVSGGSACRVGAASTSGGGGSGARTAEEGPGSAVSGL